MSNKRITELIPLSRADLSADDLIPVADVSIPETKKVTMEDLASWVAYSASLIVDSSSVSKTASFLIYNGVSNGTAAFSVTSSWALLTYSASYATFVSSASNALYATSASWAPGTSIFLSTGSLYPITSSVSVSSSMARRSDTSSFVQWFGGNVDNGTVYRSISSSYASTASYISTNVVAVSSSVSQTSSLAFTASYITGSNTGTASYASVAALASVATTAVTTTNQYIYRELGPYEVDIIVNDTASFASSSVLVPAATTVNILVEAFGDVIATGSYDTTSSLALRVFDGTSTVYPMNVSTLQYPIGGTYTTGSYITGFYLKGVISATAGTWTFALNTSGSVLFYTASRLPTCYIKVNSDSWTIVTGVL